MNSFFEQCLLQQRLAMGPQRVRNGREGNQKGMQRVKITYQHPVKKGE